MPGARNSCLYQERGLQELVRYHARTPDTPAGFDPNKPFELAANIREVEIQRGAATIIQ